MGLIQVVAGGGIGLILLVCVLVIAGAGWGLFSDEGSGITTRDRTIDQPRPREYYAMWSRGTR